MTECKNLQYYSEPGNAERAHGAAVTSCSQFMTHELKPDNHGDNDKCEI